LLSECVNLNLYVFQIRRKIVMTLSDVEFIKNPEPRCPVVLILDTSGSMSGEPINALSEGVATFKKEIEKDEKAFLRVELAIITFGGSVTVEDFVTISNFVPKEFKASGETPMGKAMREALTLVENRKQIYRNSSIQYYRPWVFLITDGAPTDGDLWKESAQQLRQAEIEGKLSLFTVGVKNADMTVLAQIAPDTTPPLKLDGLKFQALFNWLSASMTRVSVSKPGEPPTLPALDGWTTAKR
jgi:uncharacterized protein YegL